MKNKKKGVSILRCDEMPVVLGNPQQLSHLFYLLLTMILNHPPLNSKLYLYLRSQPQDTDADVMDLRVDAGSRMYCIGFYTNITTDASWKLLYKNILAECAALAQQNGGEFLSHDIDNTGCLFSLNLRGKII